MGAWIETNISVVARCYLASHPTWVRGLKLDDLLTINPRVLSHPTWVRGLKLAKNLLKIFKGRRTLRGCVD